MMVSYLPFTGVLGAALVSDKLSEAQISFLAYGHFEKQAPGKTWEATAT